MTGATGFVGGATLRHAVAQGWHVRALTRRPQQPRDGVNWIEGALDRSDALAELAAGSDIVMHIAGVVNVPTRAAFEAGNATATGNVIDAARTAGVTRFVHVSSLAAREPDLSNYGWSKARAETIVKASGLDWTIVRPPAVFGPGDTEMLDIFRMARRGVALL
ncbi:NAD(P)-dependent oxidoreductase, partial [Sphingopyxis sp. KK2]|uniref:NAD-dependent epimerase/dehydratase family protein n=1 Tax=Sphingopyxis sp. KK2 TaxID=1855727 RepID=UPI002118B617